MKTKRMILIALTGVVLGAALGILAAYCRIPEYLAIPAYVVMGVIIAHAFHPKKQEDKT